MEDMTKQGKILYERAVAMNPDDALRMALEAESTEEKLFFTYIANMNLQRRDLQEFKTGISKENREEKSNEKSMGYPKI